MSEVELKPIRSPKQISNVLSFLEGLLMKGNCLVIPASLRKENLDRIHHRLVKRKLLVHRWVWWPEINRDIEHFVNHCSKCAMNIH